MITSNIFPSVSPDTKRENSSNEAISVVQAPERSSLIFLISSLDAIPSKGCVTRFRYPSADFSGFILIAKSRSAPFTGFIFQLRLFQ